MTARRPKVEIAKGEVTTTNQQLLNDIKDRLDVLIEIANNNVDEPVTLDDIEGN